MRFVQNMKGCLGKKEKLIGELVAKDLEEAERLWLIREQVFIMNDGSFEKRKNFIKIIF